MSCIHMSLLLVHIANLATEIERSCSNLTQAIDEYEKMIKEKDLL